MRHEHSRAPMRPHAHNTRVLASLGAACLLLAGCREPAPQPGEKAQRVSLTLYCGAGIRPAADALIEAFEAKHRVGIHATYAGSGRLLGQITAVQKGDLYMPGAELYVDRAVEEGLAVADTKRVVACLIPVIFVGKGNPKAIQTVADLGKQGVRVGLGDERACAIGRRSLKILEKNGIAYSAIERNVVYKSGTVNELALAVQMGNVDAVIVWDANARQFAEHGESIRIAPDRNIPSSIPIVVLKASEHPAEARTFVAFVTSAEGKAILRGHGYTVRSGLPGRS
ncbi:MAG: molybdate ABC transporter substrate-binding protein [Kiritimatiellae bacterium]|nr:molybdate ABC transporter substrate-binding protein [Kiritimatiellia bacterium]